MSDKVNVQDVVFSKVVLISCLVLFVLLLFFKSSWAFYSLIPILFVLPVLTSKVGDKKGLVKNNKPNGVVGTSDSDCGGSCDS